MKALDLYCGAGGSSEGLFRAGFDVTGVDIDPKCAKHYPYKFVAANVFELDPEWIAQFDLVSSSPPCQFASLLRHRTGKEYVNHIPATRELLNSIEIPYFIENVQSASKHLIDPVKLCGTSFGLGSMCRDGTYRQLWRHRMIESSFEIRPHPRGCMHTGQPVGVFGNGGPGQQTRGYKGYPEECQEAMGLDHYMPRKYISQSIPPAYTEYIAHEFLRSLK